MIRDLDSTLQALLNAGADPGSTLATADISFALPDAQWRGTLDSLTVNCYLYDVHENLEMRTNEPLVVRTGQLAGCRVHGWGAFAGGNAPGLSFLTVPWLHEHSVAAVASDTWGVEVRPNEIEGAFQPFHLPALVYMGLALGEMFDFDALAIACAEDGNYDMLVSASPLPFVGTAGGPPGPVAIR